MIMGRGRAADEPTPGATTTPAAEPVPPAATLYEAAPLSTLPMPFDIAADHDQVILHVTEAGDIDADPGRLLPRALENIGREASRRGCASVWGLQHQMSIDQGWCMITVIATGARPSLAPDGPVQV